MNIFCLSALFGLSVCSSTPIHHLIRRQTLQDQIPLRIANVKPSENEIEGNELVPPATTTTVKITDDLVESNDISIDRSDDYYSSTIDKSDKISYHKDEKASEKIIYNEHVSVVSPVKAVFSLFGGLLGAVTDTVGKVAVGTVDLAGKVVNESVDIAKEVGFDRQIGTVSRSVGNLVVDGAGLLKSALDYKVEAGERIFTSLGEKFDKMREKEVTVDNQEEVSLKPEYARNSNQEEEIN